jgi:hypothetical protein
MVDVAWTTLDFSATSSWRTVEVDHGRVVEVEGLGCTIGVA